jgi:PadR family transcriptional regulator PadR
LKFAVASTLLDACVLGVLSKEPTYGYDLTQRIKTTIDVSESTLYPVLRRLLKEGLLSTYDEPFDGRNRRYYSITSKGKDILGVYIEDWQIHKCNIDILLRGGISDEQE